MLEVENLSKTFPSGLLKKKYIEALRDVSFKIKKGETLGILGESGSGKSTLGRLILRLIEPSSGKIYFNGTEITALKKKELTKFRKKIQIIFQHPESALNPRMRLYDSMAEPLRIHKITKTKSDEKAKIRELLETVNLQEELLKRYPNQLSGGQIQRVVIARVLALEPEFIVADEPTSMLDVSIQAQILKLMKDLQKKNGISYLFISHDPEVVVHMASRIGVIKRGEMVEIGKVKEILKRPEHTYTKKILTLSRGLS